MKKILFAALSLTMAMGASADESYKAADAKLNHVYKEITVRLANDPATKKLLVEAQRNWLRFRDAECAFQSSGVEGGSIYPEIMASCLAQITAQRIEHLERYANCEEGDLACPVPR